MVPYLPANCTSERPPHLEPVGMEAAVERFRLKRADVLVASDRKTSSSPRAQSQVVPAGTSHPRFSWHANTQLPRERDKSSRAASSKTAEQNCRLHCRQNRRRPAPCRPPGPPLGQWGVCPIARGIALYFLAAARPSYFLFWVLTGAPPYSIHARSALGLSGRRVAAFSASTTIR